MDAATIETLVDLVIDLDRAGVQELIPDGDRLRYCPRSALTPALAERLRTHKHELLAMLRPPEDPDRADSGLAWEDCIDPPDPCPDCGGLLSWWTALGDRRCLTCDPPVKAMRALERAERIRRRHGKPSPPGAAEMLAELKRLTGTCKSAN